MPHTGNSVQGRHIRCPRRWQKHHHRSPRHDSAQERFKGRYSGGGTPLRSFPADQSWATKPAWKLLAREKDAFIRPSPSGDTLGGVARKTRETMMVCEAAGYDIIIVENRRCRSVRDHGGIHGRFFFYSCNWQTLAMNCRVLKKGVMEIADAIVINKAEGDNRPKAELAKSQYINALHLLKPKKPSLASSGHALQRSTQRGCR